MNDSLPAASFLFLPHTHVEMSFSLLFTEKFSYNLCYFAVSKNNIDCFTLLLLFLYGKTKKLKSIDFVCFIENDSKIEYDK